MRTRFIMKLCFLYLLVWCMSSCKSDNGDSVRPVALECMYMEDAAIPKRNPGTP